MKNQLIGVAISIQKGFAAAIKFGAERLKINCIQICLKNSLAWTGKAITQEILNNYFTALKNSKIKAVFAHAGLLIHLGSKKQSVVENSIKSLIHEIYRAKILKIEFLCIHLDSPRFESIEESITFFATQLNIVINETDSTNVTILLETMAGKKLGSKFNELAEIIKQINNKKRIGICLDTCHIFAAGYDFSTKEKYDFLWSEFDSTIGLKYLKLIHLNDSKFECNSQKDRHEFIGSGKIGLAAFEFLLNDKKLKNIPKILETPKENLEFEGDLKSLKLIKSLIKN